MLSYYRKNDKRLPGSPDIAIPRHRIAIFVDGESHMLIPYEEETANSILYVSVLQEQLEELGHIGASYDMYLLDDLKDGLVPEHKINIFLATAMIRNVPTPMPTV